MVPQAYGLKASLLPTQLVPRSSSNSEKSGLIDGAKPEKKPCVPSNTVPGPEKPALPSAAARRPDCAAQPACSRLVEDPSARYSMMPEAMLPAMPSPSVIAGAPSPLTIAAEIVAAKVPSTAVG